MNNDKQDAPLRLDGGLSEALTAHKPGEADHLSKNDLAFGLRLLSATQSEANRVTDRILEDEREQTRVAKRRADEVEGDLYCLRKLHQMLAEPRYARALISLLQAEAVAIDDEIAAFEKR